MTRWCLPIIRTFTSPVGGSSGSGSSAAATVRMSGIGSPSATKHSGWATTYGSEPRRRSPAFTARSSVVSTPGSKQPTISSDFHRGGFVFASVSGISLSLLFSSFAQQFAPFDSHRVGGTAGLQNGEAGGDPVSDRPLRHPELLRRLRDRQELR